MSQLKKVLVDVIVPVPARGWSVNELSARLRGIGQQSAKFKWRAIIVSGSDPFAVKSLARVLVPAKRRCYVELSLRLGDISDLVYQGVAASRSHYLTYAHEGDLWHPDHLSSMVTAARQSESDVVVMGGGFRDHADVASLLESGINPIGDGSMMHRSRLLDFVGGWPRGQGIDYVEWLCSSLFAAGGEFFAVASPVSVRRRIVDSTKPQLQMTLFADA